MSSDSRAFFRPIWFLDSFHFLGVVLLEADVGVQPVELDVVQLGIGVELSLVELSPAHGNDLVGV